VAISTIVLVSGLPTGARAACVGGSPNGIVDLGEACDDGDDLTGDGCSNTCDTDSDEARKCASKKLKETGKFAVAVAKCHAAAAGEGTEVEDACVEKAVTKLFGKFSSIEDKGGCNTTADPSIIGAQATATVASLAVQLDESFGADDCAKKKIAAMGKAIYGDLKCESKAAKDGTAVDADCTQGVEEKLDSQFGKADDSGTCTETGDEDMVSDEIDYALAAFAAQLSLTTVPGVLVATADSLSERLLEAATAIDALTGTARADQLRDIADLLDEANDLAYAGDAAGAFAKLSEVRAQFKALTADDADAQLVPLWQAASDAIEGMILSFDMLTDFSPWQDELTDDDVYLTGTSDTQLQTDASDTLTELQGLTPGEQTTLGVDADVLDSLGDILGVRDDFEVWWDDLGAQTGGVPGQLDLSAQMTLVTSGVLDHSAVAHAIAAYVESLTARVNAPDFVAAALKSGPPGARGIFYCDADDARCAGQTLNVTFGCALRSFQLSANLKNPKEVKQMLDAAILLSTFNANPAGRAPAARKAAAGIAALDAKLVAGHHSYVHYRIWCDCCFIDSCGFLWQGTRRAYVTKEYDWEHLKAPNATAETGADAWQWNKESDYQDLADLLGQSSAGVAAKVAAANGLACP
jgi:cysteine-rich repeat protein